MRKAFLILALSAALTGGARAYLLTEDLPNLGNNLIAEIKNYAQYAQQTWNQLTQISQGATRIEQGVMQIENQITQIERLGNPQTYVNVLHLSDFIALAGQLASGVGNPLTQIQTAANGPKALAYTANGLYANLANAVDRFGKPVQFASNDFRKFDAVNQTYSAYDASLRAYNQQAGLVQSQLTAAMNHANGAGDLITSIKHLIHVVGLGAQINAMGHTALLSGQRLSAQHQMNQNDAARTQEAQRQQAAQERLSDLQASANGWAQLCGGAVTAGTAGGGLP